MKKTIEVVPYNKDWPSIYEKEAEVIKNALGDNCLAVHHIGSTSVPELASKPQIDIIASVKSLESALNLRTLEYVFKNELNIPLRYFFSKNNSFSKINLHVYEESHPEIELNLMFRDYLRTNPDAREIYAKLKENLITDESSFNKENSVFTNYTLRKGDFIRGILKSAGFNRVRILKCNDATEWVAAKHFREKYFFGHYEIEDPYTWTFNHDSHTHLVLYKGVDIVGYAHIQFWQDKTHYKRAAIRIIVIDDVWQNQNLGSEFLVFIEKWLKNLGVKSVHAESRSSSLGFYLKNGYAKMPFNDQDGYESDPEDIPVGKVL